MEAKVINKYKLKDYGQLRAIAKTWFNKFIRLRDTDDYGYGNCIVKDTQLKYGTEYAQAGHYYAAGVYKSLEFNEDNVHLQSKQDNYFGHDFARYTHNLTKKIGIERVNTLHGIAAYEKKYGFKPDRFSMIETIEKYKLKVKQITKTKMFHVK